MAKILDRTFEIHGHFIIIKELGGNKVVCKCLDCGYIDTYNKQNIVDESTACTGCKLIKASTSIEGKIYNDMLILGKNKDGTLKCECLKCHSIDSYKQSDVKNKRTICTKCVGLEATQSLLGSTFGDLLVVQDIGEQSIKCHCDKCKKNGIYDKKAFIKEEVSCKFCGPKISKRKKIDKPNVRASVLQYIQLYGIAYEICGEKYYKCKCKKCGQEMVLSGNEMKKHKCQGMQGLYR